MTLIDGSAEGAKRRRVGGGSGAGDRRRRRRPLASAMVAKSEKRTGQLLEPARTTTNDKRTTHKHTHIYRINFSREYRGRTSTIVSLIVVGYGASLDVVRSCYA